MYLEGSEVKKKTILSHFTLRWGATTPKSFTNVPSLILAVNLSYNHDIIFGWSKFWMNKIKA